MKFTIALTEPGYSARELTCQPHGPSPPNQNMQSSSSLKRIPVRLLEPGMFIHAFCGSWMDHPFWRDSFLLESDADLLKVRNSSVSEVWIDVSRGRDVAQDADGVESLESAQAVVDERLARAEGAPVGEAVPIEQEFRRAAMICARARQAVVAMFSEARMGKAIRVDEVDALVTEISGSVMRNRGALISLARLRSADEYTYMHSVAVCALMISLARELGLSEEHVKAAGQAGLLHDLGKAMVPLDVLNKPGKLTENEFEVVRSHPGAGAGLLADVAGIDPVTLDVCLHHHEKVDGSGYPSRLTTDEISLFARMGAICDVYDAITSNRPYKAGWDPAESIRRMAEWTNGHFDEGVFHAFVRCVGIYPTGSLVRLESGRLAVVLDQNAQSLLTPRVRVFYAADSQTALAPQTLDLAAPGCADRIVGREDSAKWGFSGLERYWRLEC